MNLFVKGQFTSHSGLVLPFKINCDALTDEDLDCLASIAHERLQLPWKDIGKVVGVPRGGLRLAAILQQYAGHGPLKLIVDDVLTTGHSMAAMRAEELWPETCLGLVIFARSEPESWIQTIFRLNRFLR